MRNKTFLIGITGGMGAGKSAASELFRKEGYPVLSADEFARKVTEPGSPAMREISEQIGAEFENRDGSLNRAKLREKITADPSARKKLEAITHPRIQALTKQEANRLFSEGNKVVFYEAPLLYEANSADAMDLIICVAADDNLRIKRVMDRDGVTEEDAKKLIAAQIPQSEKITRADFVLWNNEDAGKLRTFVEELLTKINHRISANP